MNCNACSGSFKDPKILCCTRLCKDCLQNYIETTVKDDFIACLVCKTKIKIPDPYRPRDEWSSQYRTDLFLQRMLQADAQVQSKHTCFVCESSRGAVTPSTKYCFTCDTYYCDGCNELHLQLRGLQGHSIVALPDLQTKDLMLHRRLYCCTHKDKPLDVFCKLTSSDRGESSSALSSASAVSVMGGTRPESGNVVCTICAEELKKTCKTIPLDKAAKDIDDKLKRVRSKITAVIDVQEQKHEALQERCKKMASQNEQKIKDVEAAFKRIQEAIDERKQYLLSTLRETRDKSNRGLTSMAAQTASFLSALKDVQTLLTWVKECGTEYDVVTSGDVIIEQYNNLYECSTDPSTVDITRFRSNIHIEEGVVNTFVQLVNMIGSEGEGHIVAYKTKQLPLKMAEDQTEPSIKDVLLLEDGSLIATDNTNKAVKMVTTTDAGDPRIVRLNLKSQPWGVTKLQVNVLAVTGHQCLYIVTKTEDLHLQSTVRTRKDYWGVTALSPINLAVTCKFPPSVDVLDITGRQLRTLDTNGTGEPLFTMPQYICGLQDKLYVSDREGKVISCIDSHGKDIFTFRGSKRQQLQHPKGIETSKSGHLFVVEDDEVWLLSSLGKLRCKIIGGIPGLRAVSEENNTLCLSVDGRGVLIYKIIDMDNV